MIDEDALKVLYRLHRHGYTAYLVGGSVRDLLLGRKPKDFDIATNAHPHEINGLFKNSRTIGRRFRLVHILFKGGKRIEVSTFRSRLEYEEVENEEGEIIRTDSFGTPPEDAFRRDITINGLFYNIADFSIIDYVRGMADLDQKVIRIIGDPSERFEEDPVRMIRVIRHATRTGFSIEDRTYQAILGQRKAILQCSPSRLRDEFVRDLKEGVAKPSLSLMLQTGLLLSLFPAVQRVFGDRNPLNKNDQHFFLSLFGLVDELFRMDKQVPDSILFALFLTPMLRVSIPEHPFLGEKERLLYQAQSIRLTVQETLIPFSVPRAIKENTSQILVAQSYLRKALDRGIIPKRMKKKKYFEEAVLLYGLEAQAKGEEVPHLLRNASLPNLLPWWPQKPARRRRRRNRRLPLLHQHGRKEEGELRKQKQQGSTGNKTN